MKIKLRTSLVSERWNGRIGKVYECSDAAGARLVAKGAAYKAPDDADVDGRLPEGPPPKSRRDQFARARAAKEKRARAAQEKKKPERATLAPPEAAVTTGGPANCAGTTKKNNPCMKAPAENSQFCAVHMEELPEENAGDDQAEAEG